MRITSFMFVATLALGAAACGPSRTTYARYPEAAATFDRSAQDPKALAVADKMIEAAGGTAKWTAAKQLKWHQTVTHDGKPIIEGEQAWDRWNGRHYARAKRGEEGDLVVIREIYSTVENAYLDPGQGKNMKKLDGGSDNAIKMAKDRWEFDTAVMFMPFLLEEPGAKLEYVEEMQGEDGKPADIIKVTFDPKDKTRTSEYRIAVSRETNQIVRFEIHKAGTPDTERLGYAVTSWLDAGGLKYPGQLENLGLKGEVITFASLSSGEPDENLFIPPPLL
jgi:hypothetical protein